MRMEMDQVNRIETLEEICMADPFQPNKGMVKAKEVVDNYDYFTEVYSKSFIASIIEAVKTKEGIQSPRTIFVPTKEVLRKMIRAVIKFGDCKDRARFFLRFGVVENPLGIMQGEGLLPEPERNVRGNQAM